LFTAITAVEVAFGLAMLAGAIHFGRLDNEYLAWVLCVKAAGFLGLAALSTQDLLPRAQPAARA
jgi:predicted MFS family arabinose efflux permease